MSFFLSYLCSVSIFSRFTVTFREPEIIKRNRIKSGKKTCIWTCLLFKLVSQEFNFNASDSVYATYYHYIRQIRRHHFDWHKNCTQNVLIYQSNYLFRNTEIISHYCIRPWILLSDSQILLQTFYYTFCTNISFERASLYALKVYILLSQANDVFFEFFYLFLP